jgi:hypothetical protein
MAIVTLRPEGIAQTLSTQHFSKGRAFLRGSGIFSSIGAVLLPILAKVGKYLFPKATEFVADTASGLLDGKSFSDSVKRGAARTIDSVNTDIQRKMRGGGKRKMIGLSTPNRRHKKGQKKTMTHIFPKHS